MEDESSEYLKLSNEYKSKVFYLEDDKKILRTRGDKFEEVFLTCSNNLLTCKDEKPSRFVWFSLGALTTTILGLTGIYFLKK